MDEKIKDVFESVEKACGVVISDLRSKKRDRETSHARCVASYLLYSCCGESTINVGKLLNIDHSTVIYHKHKIIAALDGYDPVLLKTYEKVTSILNFDEIFRLEVTRLVQVIYQSKETDLIKILKQYIETHESKKATPAELR